MLKIINVTENDIKHGRPCNAEECAVARAIERHLKENVDIVVGTTYIHFGTRFVLTPKVAGDFVRRFDDNPEAAHSPFTFTLEIPDHLLK